MLTLLTWLHDLKFVATQTWAACSKAENISARGGSQRRLSLRLATHISAWRQRVSAELSLRLLPIYRCLGLRRAMGPRSQTRSRRARIVSTTTQP